MNSPAVPANSINVYIVCPPGVDPATHHVVPNLNKVGWMFGQMTEGQIIDQVKMVDDYAKVLEKWVEAARGVLKQKLPMPEKPGEETVTRGILYEAHYIKSTRADVDRDKVKAYFKDKYPEYCKSSEILTLKIVPVTQSS